MLLHNVIISLKMISNFQVTHRFTQELKIQPIMSCITFTLLHNIFNIYGCKIKSQEEKWKCNIKRHKMTTDTQNDQKQTQNNLKERQNDHRDAEWLQRDK